MTETIPTDRALEILAMTANGNPDTDSPTMGPRPARAVLAELNWLKAQKARLELQLQLANIHPEARQVAADEIELWMAGPVNEETPLFAAVTAAEARRARSEGQDTGQTPPGAPEGLS